MSLLLQIGPKNFNPKNLYAMKKNSTLVKVQVLETCSWVNLDYSLSTLIHDSNNLGNLI